MHTRGTRVLLRHYLEQGGGKAELARRFGVSRRTVYHWIETGQLDRDLDDAAAHYAARPTVSRRLDAYRGIIQERLQTYPLLRAPRSACLRRSALPDTPAVTHRSKSMFARFVRTHRSRPCNASRRRRAFKARWILRASTCPGAGVTHCWSYSDTRASFGSSSSHDRPCSVCSQGLRARLAISAVCRRSCCSIRCAPSSSVMIG